MYKWVVGVLFGLTFITQAFSSSSLSTIRSETYSEGMLREVSLTIKFSEGLKAVDFVVLDDPDWSSSDIEGNAIIEFELNKKGEPTDLVVIDSSNDNLVAIALDGVKASTYRGGADKIKHRITFNSTIEITEANQSDTDEALIKEIMEAQNE